MFKICSELYSTLITAPWAGNRLCYITEKFSGLAVVSRFQQTSPQILKAYVTVLIHPAL